jgi:hypothetical protein
MQISVNVKLPDMFLLSNIDDSCLGLASLLTCCKIS